MGIEPKLTLCCQNQSPLLTSISLQPAFARRPEKGFEHRYFYNDLPRRLRSKVIIVNPLSFLTRCTQQRFPKRVNGNLSVLSNHFRCTHYSQSFYCTLYFTKSARTLVYRLSFSTPFYRLTVERPITPETGFEPIRHK